MSLIRAQSVFPLPSWIPARLTKTSMGCSTIELNPKGGLFFWSCQGPSRCPSGKTVTPVPLSMASLLPGEAALPLTRPALPVGTRFVCLAAVTSLLGSSWCPFGRILGVGLLAEPVSAGGSDRPPPWQSLSQSHSAPLRALEIPPQLQPRRSFRFLWRPRPHPSPKLSLRVHEALQR